MNYTIRIPLSLTALCALGIAALAPNAVQAAPGSLTGQYYKLKASDPNRNPDVNDNPIDGGIVTGLVQNTLGPDGLPVATALGKMAHPSPGFTDINGLSEILWWTPQTNIVLSEKTQMDSADLDINSGFYPDGQTSDSPYTRAVHWCGDFNLTAHTLVPMSLSADDDAWAFIDGNLALDNGGVKAPGFVTNGTIDLAAGMHHLDLFQADRHAVESSIDFDASSITFTPSNCAPVPEPCSLALLALGGGPLLALRRRRK